MMIKYYHDLVQGSPEWFSARCGLLTASEMKLIITPSKLEYSDSEKEKSHLYELAAQRISNYVEPHFLGDEMIRGKEDEIEAKIVYANNYGETQDIGFVTNDEWGFTIGYSPDWLIGQDGQAECKSRRQKFQIQTIVDGKMPDEFKIQVQTGLLVTRRKYCDFVSYSGGLPMYSLPIYPDLRIQDAIISAATIFHNRMKVVIETYYAKLATPGARLIPTERKKPEGEIVL